jgi:sugar/nucleoside kinase (ribokinase family)
MFDVITVGEALVEIMRPDRDQPLDTTGLFRGPFASGAPAIFAVAAARLGLSAGLISGVGDDAFGRLLRTRLEDEGVDISGLQTVPGYSTGMAFVGYTAGGSREFVFHLRHSASGAIDTNYLASDYFSGVQWLHLSGSALALSEAGRSACSKTLELTLAAGGRLSLDPNLRPELMPLDEAREALAPYLAAADLILPTVEEARALTGANDDNQAAKMMLDDKERVVVFKRGAKGCSVFTQKTRVDVAGFSVEEVDPTGAGDCFNAAFVLGLKSGWELERVAQFANAAGALAIIKQGPMEGAPTPQQIKLLINAKVDDQRKR